MLARRAVDAAVHAGAEYADARLTSVIQHAIWFADNQIGEAEEVGIGIRVLVNGYWGFAACPSADADTAGTLARSAVAQAVVNARGAIPRTVDLGKNPAAVGTWTSPIEIDPFTIPIEEKHAFTRYWMECAKRIGLNIDTMQSHLDFVREERVVATSDGGDFVQTIYEGGGQIFVQAPALNGGSVLMPGFETSARGWELFLDPHVPDALRAIPDRVRALVDMQRNTKPAAIGRYTVVCDGVTMAELVRATVGAATQLDRALGYEATDSGTSFLDDPLGMLGTYRVGSSLVHVTANRSAPAQLATVKWDSEGVEPPVIHLINNGILTDFQTTREQAAWLAPYYATIGKPVTSNGCAASENALGITMQHLPNLSLEPGKSATSLEQLINDVADGILIERGTIAQLDSQVRTGLLSGQFRQIRNGRLGALLTNGAVQFNTLDLWNNIGVLGGPSTRAVVPFSRYPLGWLGLDDAKGMPPQRSSHSVQAVAATIANQPMINPWRKA